MRGCEGSGRARVPCSFVAQPPPCAPRSVLQSFICSGVALGSAPLIRPSLVPLRAFGAPASGRGCALPAGGGRVIVVRLFFHLFCSGAFAAPVAVSRNIIARLVVWAVPPLWGGCPCRAPAAGAAAAPGGTPPTGALPSVGTAVSLRGFFFGYRLELRAGCQGVSPLAQACEVCPPAPLLECPQAGDIFCLARGARGSRFLLGACAPAPLAGGAPPAPLHPGARRRGGRCFSWYFVSSDFAIFDDPPVDQR